MRTNQLPFNSESKSTRLGGVLVLLLPNNAVAASLCNLKTGHAFIITLLLAFILTFNLWSNNINEDGASL